MLKWTIINHGIYGVLKCENAIQYDEIQSYGQTLELNKTNIVLLT